MSTALHAQNIVEDEGILSKNGYARMVGFGVGASYRTFLDHALSNIPYSRVGTAACISHQKTDDIQHTELTLQASYLNMRRKADDLLKGSAKSLKAAVDYRQTYKIALFDEDRYDIRVGGMLSLLFDYRNAPHLNYSARSYDYAGSLGLYGKIARAVPSYERESHIVLDLSIPFLSSIGRPPFTNVGGLYDPEYKPLNSFFAQNQVATFGKFFRLVTRVHYIYPLKNGNKFKFTYQWDYYRMKGPTTVFSAEHMLTVAFMFNY